MGRCAAFSRLRVQLTHSSRESIPMQGGTTFHFVTDGIHRALEKATQATNGVSEASLLLSSSTL